MGWVAFLIVSSDGTAGSPQLTGVLNLAKLVHRLVAAELAKNSFAVGLNAYLISDYMKQLLPGRAGSVDGVLQHLEEDNPGEEQRDARGVPLGGGGDNVGDE
ncbi:hypothetical protein OsJ_01394 [Oryza sativa Japonica Group]|uniref:Uncharacterized protein n=1 Tax=Oryza sativa subsp. japonica TaxID=39947 RepID=A2ZS31_ORYSJ|nr:hypothetical protein OsJ_01394 [Oryza sativa Japonica Group]